MKWFKVWSIAFLTIVFAFGNPLNGVDMRAQTISTPMATVQASQYPLLMFVPELKITGKITTIAELNALLLSSKIQLTQNDLLGRGDMSWYSASVGGPNNPPYPNFDLEVRVIGGEITDVIVSYGSTGSDFDSKTWEQINPARLLTTYGNPSAVSIKADGIFATVYITWETQRVAVSYHWRVPVAEHEILSLCFTPKLSSFFSRTVVEELSVTKHIQAAVVERLDLRLYSPESRSLQPGMLEGITTIDDFAIAVRAGKCLKSPLAFWL